MHVHVHLEIAKVEIMMKRVGWRGSSYALEKGMKSVVKKPGDCPELERKRRESGCGAPGSFTTDRKTREYVLAP